MHPNILLVFLKPDQSPLTHPVILPYNLHMTNIVEKSPWLTVSDVARHLKLSNEMVYKILQSGELPAIRVRTSWRISRETLDQWVAIQRMNARYAKLPKLEAEVLRNFKQGLQKLYGPRFVEMYLYGSAARGTATKDSDLDVIVVLNAIDDRWAELKLIREIAYEVSYGQGKAVLVSSFVVSQQELLSENSPVLIRIREEGRIAA